MDQNITTVERAFQLARLAEATNITDIKRALQKEGYRFGDLEGKSLVRQLQNIINERDAPSPNR